MIPRSEILQNYNNKNDRLKKKPLNILVASLFVYTIDIRKYNVENIYLNRQLQSRKVCLYLQLELTKSSAFFYVPIPKSPSKFRRKRESQIVQH